jgi:hypothetical protein
MRGHIMPVLASCSDNKENVAAVLHGLRSQGIENPEQYVADTEYIFFSRGPRDGGKGDTYDVIVRFPSWQNIPRYVYKAIATAVREEALRVDAILDIQFQMFNDFCDYYSEVCFDSLSGGALGLNNCFFKREQTTVHDELRFRSRGEIAIYDELKRRNVLFFPNPAAVLGTTAAEYGADVKKKEPDFLVCLKGKWGILEINGDSYHSGVVKTAKDHDRARLFNHYGLYFVQAYDSQKCKDDPAGVVDEFLTLLSNHK